MNKHTSALFAFLLIAAAHASGQTIMVTSDLPRADKALTAACGGAWSSVMPAVLSNKPMPMDDVHAAQVSCLLKTLTTTTFDRHNPAADQSFVDLKVGLLLDAYAPPAYEVFAKQLDEFSGRVQHGLLSALVDVGDPKATRMYFDMRHASPQPVPDTVLSYYRAMLEGHCRKAPCSPRLAESVAIVHANLDVVERDLRGIVMLAKPEGASPDELSHVAAVHREAQDLLATVHRMR